LTTRSFEKKAARWRRNGNWCCANTSLRALSDGIYFCDADALLIAVGADPFQLVEEAVVAAASLSGGAPALRDKYIPASADVFGWCTWDAFYSDVSAKGEVQS